MLGLLEEYKDELAMHRARVPITPQRKESSKSATDELIDPNHAPIFKLLLVSEPPTLSLLLVVILMS